MSSLATDLAVYASIVFFFRWKDHCDGVAEWWFLFTSAKCIGIVVRGVRGAVAGCGHQWWKEKSVRLSITLAPPTQTACHGTLSPPTTILIHHPHCTLTGAICVKLYLRHKRTDNRPKSHVRLSVVSVRGVHPMDGRSAMLHRNLRGEE